MSSQPRLPADALCRRRHPHLWTMSVPLIPYDDNDELLQLDRRHACDTTGCTESRAPLENERLNRLR
jgi:hypothetical protein